MSKDDYKEYEITQKKVEKYIGKPYFVVYSVGEPLDKIVFKGKVKFIRPKSSFVLQEYESEILDSPTWLEVCGVANESIIQSGDYHHIFLDDINSKKDDGEVTTFTLIMGS